MTRKDRIRRGLDWAERQGVIRSWYAQGAMPGVRWTVEGVAFGTRVWKTSEVEAFLAGVDCIEVAVNALGRKA